MSGEVRPAPSREAPEGYEYVAVVSENWRLVTGKLCRRMGRQYAICRKPSAAEVLRPKRRRGQPVVDWWAYCEDHLHAHGKWIEGGSVMHWILREVRAPAPRDAQGGRQ